MSDTHFSFAVVATKFWSKRFSVTGKSCFEFVVALYFFIVFDPICLSKPERIRLLFDNTLKRLSKRDILEKCPDISTSTIEITLAGLLKEGYIIKIGAGKKTAYIRNIPDESLGNCCF